MKIKELFLTLLLILLLACKDNKSSDNKMIRENKSLDNELKKVIIDYQKTYPIPIKNERLIKNIYIYLVNFIKSEKDTVIKITRTSSGLDSIISSKSGDGSIYEDKELKPTLISDNDKLGSKFILKRNIKIDKKYYNNSGIFNEGFTPIHTYKINSKNIKLIDIDTVWQNWD
jgi:hypothetical protein